MVGHRIAYGLWLLGWLLVWALSKSAMPGCILAGSLGAAALEIALTALADRCLRVSLCAQLSAQKGETVEALLTVENGSVLTCAAVCLRVGCRPERLSKPCAAAQERAAAYEKSRAGGPVYLVRCLGCGTESRYLRRGKIVQLLEQHPKTRSCVCKKCGGRSFSLIVEEGLR